MMGCWKVPKIWSNNQKSDILIFFFLISGLAFWNPETVNYVKHRVESLLSVKKKSILFWFISKKRKLLSAFLKLINFTFTFTNLVTVNIFCTWLAPSIQQKFGLCPVFIAFPDNAWSMSYSSLLLLFGNYTGCSRKPPTF